MRNLFRLISTSLFLVGVFSVISLAQDGEQQKPKPINQRQHQQQKRIVNGVKEGDISNQELKRLELEQKQIRLQERRFRSDGDFTTQERARVQHNLNQSNRHIRRASRN